MFSALAYAMRCAEIALPLFRQNPLQRPYRDVKQQHGSETRTYEFLEIDDREMVDDGSFTVEMDSEDVKIIQEAAREALEMLDLVLDGKTSDRR